MSRYIDADAYAADLWKLRENYQMLDDTQTADKIMHGIFRAEQALKEQPTVDAVPVEWIKNYVKRLEDNGNTFAAVQYEMMLDDYLADGERKDGEHDNQRM